MPLILNNFITNKAFCLDYHVKPISVRKFIEFGIFGDTIIDFTGNITFTEDNASNALKYIFHIFFYIVAHIGLPTLKVGL